MLYSEGDMDVETEGSGMDEKGKSGVPKEAASQSRKKRKKKKERRSSQIDDR